MLSSRQHLLGEHLLTRRRQMHPGLVVHLLIPDRAVLHVIERTADLGGEARIELPRASGGTDLLQCHTLAHHLAESLMDRRDEVRRYGHFTSALPCSNCGLSAGGRMYPAVGLR